MPVQRCTVDGRPEGTKLSACLQFLSSHRGNVTGVSLFSARPRLATRLARSCGSADATAEISRGSAAATLCATLEAAVAWVAPSTEPRSVSPAAKRNPPRSFIWNEGAAEVAASLVRTRTTASIGSIERSGAPSDGTSSTCSNRLANGLPRRDGITTSIRPGFASGWSAESAKRAAYRSSMTCRFGRRRLIASTTPAATRKTIVAWSCARTTRPKGAAPMLTYSCWQGRC